MYKRVFYSFFSIFFLVHILIADDGLKNVFKNKQMDINPEMYVLFEEESMIMFDKQTDEYLIEITPDAKLFIRSHEIDYDSGHETVVKNYYDNLKKLLDKRNVLGAKGVRIGVASAKLAAKAVEGAIELIVSGFDEDKEKELEEKLEREAERIEYNAENIENDANEIEYLIDEVNDMSDKIQDHIPELKKFNLTFDKVVFE